MTLIENVLMALGLLPVKGLADSMQQSKTLTIMVIIAIILFASLGVFLYKMAATQ